MRQQSVVGVVLAARPPTQRPAPLQCTVRHYQLLRRQHYPLPHPCLLSALHQIGLSGFLACSRHRCPRQTARAQRHAWPPSTMPPNAQNRCEWPRPAPPCTSPAGQQLPLCS